MEKEKVMLYAFSATCFLACVSCSPEKQVQSEKMFSLIPASESGIFFKNNIVEKPQDFQLELAYLYNGGGVGISDFNQDGLQDLYFTSNQSGDKLYQNLGDFKFKDVSSNALIDIYGGWKNGIAISDVNGDGLDDIYVCRGGSFENTADNENLLFINQGNLTFIESAAKYGVNDPGISISAVFFDLENDGDLDLYVTNRPNTFDNSFLSLAKGKEENNRFNSDQLYRNEGGQKFMNITAIAGLQPNFAYGLNVIAGDINDDGYQDLYVCNDFAENDYVYINQKNGTFKHFEKNIANHISFSSMGADIGDIDNDGREDIFISEMRPEDYRRSKTSMPAMNPAVYDSLKMYGIAFQFMHNTLLYNQGKGYFSEIAHMCNLDKTEWSWAPLIVDLNNDGLKDLFVATGHKRDVMDRDVDALIQDFKRSKTQFNSIGDLLSKLPTIKTTNYIFQNTGNFTFSKVMKDWGMDQISFSNGAAAADLDNDGDLDLVVNNVDDAAFLYRNNNIEQNNSIRVKLVDYPGNKDGLGSRIQLEESDNKYQFSSVRRVRGYLSCTEEYTHFGIAKKEKAKSINVTWPDGRVSVIKDPVANKVHLISYTKSKAPNAQVPAKQVLFVDRSKEDIFPVFQHKENDFNDFHKQILLPHRLSRQGTEINVADLNGDKLEDFYIGNAKDVEGAVYFQKNQGNFEKSVQPDISKDKAYEDISSDIFDADGDGDMDLYVVSGGTEFPQGKYYQDRLYLNDGKGFFKKCSECLPPISESGGVGIHFDFDFDGDMDILRGSRVIPDKYPFAPNSYLFENKGKAKFKDVTTSKAPMLRNLGMVTDAMQVNSLIDNKPTIVIVGEWMPIKLYSYSADGLKEIDASQYGFSNSVGWWNCIIADDLDKDGDIDMIGGNLGENYKFQTSIEKPFSVYCDDFDQNGTYDVVLAKYNNSELVPIRGKQCSQEQMPFIKTKYPTYKSFSETNLQGILGDKMKSGVHYSAQTFSSKLFLNHQGKFESIPLPKLAQISTIQGIVIQDFDHDGEKEIAVAGNYFQVEIETTPADASIGLMMKYKDGKFYCVDNSESGIFLPRDVKDLKKINIAGDYALLVSNDDESMQILYPNKKINLK